MDSVEKKICFEIIELIKKGKCDESYGGWINYCYYYKKDGCPETCTYAKNGGRRTLNHP